MGWTNDDDAKMAASLLLQEHYLDSESAKQSPDNFSECVCGGWSEGSMEPGWDDHLIDVLWDAGWRPALPTSNGSETA